MEACQTQTVPMVPTLAGGGLILGWLIDFGTGAVDDLQPDPLTLRLACQSPASDQLADVAAMLPA